MGYELLELMQHPLPNARVLIAGMLTVFGMFWLSFGAQSYVVMPLIGLYDVFLLLMLHLWRKAVLAVSSTDEFFTDLRVVTHATSKFQLGLGLCIPVIVGLIFCCAGVD